MTEHIDLIRKLVWSFHRTTGIDWDDLFQEAVLGYYEYLKYEKPSFIWDEKGYREVKRKHSTFIWMVVTSHLKNVLKKYSRYKDPLISIEDLELQEPYEESALFEKLSRDATQIVEAVLSNPEEFDILSPVMARRMLIKKLIRMKWSTRRIREGITDIQLVLK